MMADMIRVIIESPFAACANGKYTKGAAEQYLRRCLLDSLLRGEAPFASHAIYPIVLDDDDPDERRRGIEAGYAWMGQAEIVVFCVDLDWSPGMLAARDRCDELAIPWRERRLKYA